MQRLLLGRLDNQNKVGNRDISFSSRSDLFGVSLARGPMAFPARIIMGIANVLDGEVFQSGSQMFSRNGGTFVARTRLLMEWG
jgi:hypothetical protein